MNKTPLKDQLFNVRAVTKIAREIKLVYKDFDDTRFVNEVVKKFPELELKQRIAWIAQMLHEYLPSDYPKALKILIDSLPPPNDPSKTDNDFGDFIYAPHGEFVAQYGCGATHLKVSIDALYQLTQRFSMEDPIRRFINTFPSETYTAIERWSHDSHYHVRRLCSEGTRPRLPWSRAITTPIDWAMPILDELMADPTRFVTRSVANHLNDIAKVQPDLAIDALRRWKLSGKQHGKEMDFIVRHALRGLIKQGHPAALGLIGVVYDTNVSMVDFHIQDNRLTLGESLTFALSLKASADETLIIDYVIWFQNKRAQMRSRKVYKLKELLVRKDQVVHVQKSHPLRANMTTRSLYRGEHKIEIQVNGQILAELPFWLM